MAGHNKWSKVKHIKARVDAIKGKAFTKAVKDIAVAAKSGGGDLSANASLRLAVEKAKAVSMPAANIQRAIDKATGNLEGVNYEEVVYEGYGAGGVAVMVECMTDNKNRTVATIRHAFGKNGGSMGENGCVAWMFEKSGMITIARSSKDDEVMDVALENGADDIIEEENELIFKSSAEDFNTLIGALESVDGINILDSSLSLVATNEIEVDEQTAEKVQNLIDILEDDEDVDVVHHNMK